MPKIVIKELHVLSGFEADDDAEYAVVAALEIESCAFDFFIIKPATNRVHCVAQLRLCRISNLGAVGRDHRHRALTVSL